MLSSRPVSLLHESGDYSRITASKTPGRALKGRAGLQENVLQNGSMTANPKEKRVALQTPFRQGNSKIILQDAQASSKTAALSNARPLGDKTPKPNRQNLSLFTPGPRNGKPAKFTLLALQDETETGSPSQPPSSSRKKLRAPRTSKSFETPITKGDHWNVSDVSIEVGTSSLGEINETDANEPDYSEPEYMPPKVIEPDYEPPFELPDYREVGHILRTLAHSYPVDDTPYVYEFDSEDLLKGCDWSHEHMKLSLPDSDEDEIFGPRRPEPKVNARTAVSSRTTLRRPASRSALASKVSSIMRGRTPTVPPARPATSTAIRAPDPKPASMLPRPGTSASNSRRPPTRNDFSNHTRAATSNASTASSTKRDSDDILALQFDDELEVADDFRFPL